MWAFCSLFGRFSFSSFAVLVSYCREIFRAFFLILAWSAITSGVSASAWSRIRPTSGSVDESHMRTTRNAVRRECVITQIVCKSAYYKIRCCVESAYYQKGGA